MARRRLVSVLGAPAFAALALAGCDYAGLLRPDVLAQLDPEMVALMNELPQLDEPNEALVGRLFATGGLSRADLGTDGVFRDWVARAQGRVSLVPRDHQHAARRRWSSTSSTRITGPTRLTSGRTARGNSFGCPPPRAA